MHALRIFASYAARCGIDFRVRKTVALKKAAPALAVGAFMIMLVVKPDYFLDSASRGLLLFATSVLPAIFPFFFCSSLRTAMGAANALSKLGAKPVRVLFNAAPEGAYVLALSMLSGYPIGAATVSDLYRRGVITEAEAKKISSFTSTSGPIFILGTVGSAIFGDPVCGAVILAAHYAAALTTGLIFRGRKNSRPERPSARIAVADTDSALQQSIASSTLAMLAVGGYIVVGNMLIDAISLTGLSSALSAAMNENAAGCLRSLIYGAVEMTRGSLEAAKIPSRTLAVAVTSAVVSFGGLSVMLQSHAFLSKCNMRFSALLARKCVQCASAFVYGLVISLIIFTVL